MNIFLIIYSFIYSVILLTFIILTRQDLHSLNNKMENIISSNHCFIERICEIPFLENFCNEDC